MVILQMNRIETFPLGISCCIELVFATSHKRLNANGLVLAFEEGFNGGEL